MIITENAATMLDALHAGCTIDIIQENGEPIASIRPHIESPLRRRRGYTPANTAESEAPSSMIVQTSRKEVVEQIMEDAGAKLRTDIWGGNPGQMPHEDAIMLVRGGLVEMQHSSLSITDTGRAIAQSRIGDGMRFTGENGQPVVVTPTTDFAIGAPPEFEVMQMVNSHPRLTLAVDRGLIMITCDGPEHKVDAFMNGGVARTVAGFLADVGKVKTNSTARFGDIEVTLTVRDEAVITFHDRHASAVVKVPKPLAKVLRSYLVELAKGSKIPAVLEPVDVELRSELAVNPSCLTDMWADHGNPDDWKP